MNRFLERTDPIIAAVVIMFLASITMDGCINYAKIRYQKVEETQNKVEEKNE